MPDRIKNYLELIRLPGMFTAHADILAAFLIAGAGMDHLGTLVFLLFASSCFFSAGMALNDFFDDKIDSIERPNRPIPSGRISKPAALYTGIGLLSAGLIFARFAGVQPFCVSIGLTCAILLYDGLLKNNAMLGPMSMGLCRYLNLLMGLSILPFPGWRFIPLITGVYIFGVTVLSQKEARGGKATAHIVGCAISIWAAFLTMALLFLTHIVVNWLGLVLAFLFSLLLSVKVLRLLHNHTPDNFQKTMKVLLLSIIVLDMIIASGFVPVYASAFILMLYFPAFWSVRIFKVT